MSAEYEDIDDIRLLPPKASGKFRGGFVGTDGKAPFERTIDRLKEELARCGDENARLRGELACSQEQQAALAAALETYGCCTPDEMKAKASALLAARDKAQQVKGAAALLYPTTPRADRYQHLVSVQVDERDLAELQNGGHDDAKA